MVPSLAESAAVITVLVKWAMIPGTLTPFFLYAYLGHKRETGLKFDYFYPPTEATNCDAQNPCLAYILVDAFNFIGFSIFVIFPQLVQDFLTLWDVFGLDIISKSDNTV